MQKMKFSDQVSLGLSSYGKAFNVIFTKRLWWFFIFPLLFIILLYLGLLYGITGFDDYLQNLALDNIGLADADFWGSGVLRFLVKTLIKGVLFFLILAIFKYVGGYIVLICLSPVFAFLSEKTDKVISGKDYPLSAEQLMRDIWRGIRIALRNLFIELGYMIAIFILGLLLGWIPLIGFLFKMVSIVFLFIISSYFYGFSYLDYTSERRRMNVRTSVHFVRKYKWLAITNGAIFSIPILFSSWGVLVSAFLSIVSVVAATLAFMEIEKKEAAFASLQNDQGTVTKNEGG